MIPRGPKGENFEFGQGDFRVAKLRFAGFGQKGTEPIAEIAWAERRLSEVHGRITGSNHVRAHADQQSMCGVVYYPATTSGSSMWPSRSLMN